MLGRFKFQGGIKNGELYAAAGQTYIGGQPAGLNSTGDLVLCTSGTITAFIGIFANSNTVDGVAAGVRAKATYYAGCNVLTLEKEADGTSPFDDTLTFTPGEQLFIDGSGQWTNVNPGSQQPYGVVQAVGTNYLQVQFGGQP